MHDVAPDGSPVPVYLALPASPDLERVAEVLNGHRHVLDLGAGVGRLANPLARTGHRVVAVDDSPEMLAHLDGPTAVLADVWSLDLGERFDAVLALSHLVNDRSRARRLRLLEVCRGHLRAGGLLVVQRYPPDWRPADSDSAVGEVRVSLHDVVDLDDGFSAAVTYALGGRSWTQRFEAAVVDDDELAALADATGFEVGDALDDARCWMALTVPG